MCDQQSSAHDPPTNVTPDCAKEMAPRSAAVNVSFTVDSASEDDELAVFPTPDSNTENKAPARKARGKAAQMAKPAPAKKPTAKTRTTARRTNANSASEVEKQGTAVTKKAAPKNGRKALIEKQVSNQSDTEEVEEFGADAEEEEEVAAPAPAKATRRGRPAKAKADEEPVETAAPAKRTRKVVEKEPEPKPAKAKSTTKTRTSKRAAAVEPEPEALTIPETQQEPEPDPMDVDIEESIEIEEEEVSETMPPPPFQRPSARRIQQQAKTSRQPSAGPRRAGSASDTERDPALRRKVGDLTKKLEAMTARYDALKDVAGSSRESNFDQLKRKSEQIAKGKSLAVYV